MEDQAILVPWLLCSVRGRAPWPAVVGSTVVSKVGVTALRNLPPGYRGRVVSPTVEHTVEPTTWCQCSRPRVSRCFLLPPFTIRNPVSLVPTAVSINHYLCHSLQRLHYALFLFISVLRLFHSFICFLYIYFHIDMSTIFNVYYLLKVFVIHMSGALFQGSEKTATCFSLQTQYSQPP